MIDKTASTGFEDYSHHVSGSLVHDRAARYAKQLVSHWSGWAERVDVKDSTTTMFFAAEDDEAAWELRFETLPDRVAMSIASESVDYATVMIGVIDEHLHRFAGTRDTLVIKWETTS